MRTKVYDDGDLEIWSEGVDFFLRYDAGAHQVAIREDPISMEEAEQVRAGQDQASEVLFAIQKRLEQGNICPHESNVEE